MTEASDNLGNSAEDQGTSPEPVCQICKTPRSKHGSLVHEFSSDGRLVKGSTGNQSSQRVPSSQKAPQAALRGDPVLRMMMVRKGLITPEELEAVEQELRATGALFDVHPTRSAGRDSQAGSSESPQRSLWGVDRN